MSRKPRYTNDQEHGHQLFIKPFAPKNDAQGFYLDTIREMTVTMCTGPAGTGKTYLATYVALEALLNKDVDKIILTRPIVACEDIGYLPGDMMEKIHPYLMPLFDAVESHVGPTKAKEMLNFGKIEVIPLAYMRGRSLNRAFILLDEAQNTTIEQMKMFLTRLGYDSKMVVNGDIGQSDLPKGMESGLKFAHDRLVGRDSEIGCVEFANRHIVRHPLIGRMLQHLDGPGEKVEREAPVTREVRAPRESKAALTEKPTRHSFYEPDSKAA